MSRHTWGRCRWPCPGPAGRRQRGSARPPWTGEAPPGPSSGGCSCCRRRSPCGEKRQRAIDLDARCGRVRRQQPGRTNGSFPPHSRFTRSLHFSRHSRLAGEGARVRENGQRRKRLRRQHLSLLLTAATPVTVAALHSVLMSDAWEPHCWRAKLESFKWKVKNLFSDEQEKKLRRRRRRRIGRKMICQKCKTLLVKYGENLVSKVTVIKPLFKWKPSSRRFNFLTFLLR